MRSMTHHKREKVEVSLTELPVKKKKKNARRSKHVGLDKVQIGLTEAFEIGLGSFTAQNRTTKTRKRFSLLSKLPFPFSPHFLRLPRGLTSHRSFLPSLSFLFLLPFFNFSRSSESTNYFYPNFSFVRIVSLSFSSFYSP